MSKFYVYTYRCPTEEQPFYVGKGLGSEYSTSASWSKGIVPWNKGKEFMKGEDNPMYGINHTEDTKKKMRNAAKGRKRVYREDGSYYMIKPNENGGQK